MTTSISKILNTNFKNYEIIEINSGASRKKFFKLCNGHNSYIVSDFNGDRAEYYNYIKVYNILKDIDVSIPKIVERYNEELVIVSTDLGKLRFDKVYKDYPLSDLLSCAVETLVVLNKSIKHDNKLNLSKYNFQMFKTEIMELPEFYFPYINLKNKDLNEEFLMLWSEGFKNFKFEFNSFVHKDFNINNLIYLPNKKNHLKCGIIDFQNAYWGDNSWDLFSLLEDSRILFSDKYNQNFIEFFYSSVSSDISFEEFSNKFYFLSSSRHSRLLGRWIKLSNELNEKWYLDFISITIHRLKRSINLTKNKQLIKFYNKYIFVQ